MCVSEAGRVLTVEAETGLVDIDVDGVRRRVSAAPLVLTGTDVSPGDWLLVHTGMAVRLLEEGDARELAHTLRLVRGGEARPDDHDQPTRSATR